MQCLKSAYGRHMLDTKERDLLSLDAWSFSYHAYTRCQLGLGVAGACAEPLCTHPACSACMSRMLVTDLQCIASPSSKDVLLGPLPAILALEAGRGVRAAVARLATPRTDPGPCTQCVHGKHSGPLIIFTPLTSRVCLVATHFPSILTHVVSRGKDLLLQAGYSRGPARTDQSCSDCITHAAAACWKLPPRHKDIR